MSRDRICPSCGAPRGEPCLSNSGRLRRGGDCPARTPEVMEERYERKKGTPT